MTDQKVNCWETGQRGPKTLVLSFLDEEDKKTSLYVNPEFTVETVRMMISQKANLQEDILVLVIRRSEVQSIILKNCFHVCTYCSLKDGLYTVIFYSLWIYVIFIIFSPRLSSQGLNALCYVYKVLRFIRCRWGFRMSCWQWKSEIRVLYVLQSRHFVLSLQV